jgi:hypothetical protein
VWWLVAPVALFPLLLFPFSEIIKFGIVLGAAFVIADIVRFVTRSVPALERDERQAAAIVERPVP